ncbi:MAG: hypothetical protein HFJ40_07855 [Clostridia bacterium]|nr:hypothetical protein [Clostridia bacterium]
MGDTLITIIAIALAAVLMFVFPLMTMSDRTDDVSQLTVETATTEFVDDVRTTGKITMDKYGKFVENLSSTGNSYDIEMEAKILDENPGKKTTQASSTKIGENVYYSMYTSQILDTVSGSNGKKILALKEGDMFSASVKNTNTTMSQQLKNFFYSVTGNDTYTIAASHAGFVTANGTGN